jgi:hypothetical protein
MSPPSPGPHEPLGDGPGAEPPTAKSTPYFAVQVLTVVALLTLGLWTQLHTRQGPAAVRIVARRPTGMKRVDAQPPRPKLSELELLTLLRCSAPNEACRPPLDVTRVPTSCGPPPHTTGTYLP